MSNKTPPTLPFGTLSFNRDEFIALRWDLPLTCPTYRTRPTFDQLLVGTNVKSIAREPRTASSVGGFPLFHGRIVIKDEREEQVVVIGHGLIEAEGKWIWKGTYKEARATWEVD